ncbi:hypothetical protein FRB94_008718 [Tulasnella sp. JGI-2019a]|nr:hypothetical protein FRB94_008718 [Tulasnella sp. JGI-2019a]
MTFSFVVEHMEEDDHATKSVPPWVLLEYKQPLVVNPSYCLVRQTLIYEARPAIA